MAADTTKPAVLLHGFTASASAWDPIVPALEAEHRVLAPALDGHRGGRPFPEGAPFGAAAYADGVEREMDAAGIDRAHLVGNSLGGWIALLLAARGRALSVVCLAPAGGWRPGSAFERTLIATFAGAYAGFGLLARTDVDAFMRRPRAKRWVLGQMVHRPDRLPASVAAQIVRDVAECPVLLPSILDSKQMLLDAVGPVPGRVRIAWSAEDHVLPAKHARARFAELVPEAEQLELPGVGHVPMWDDPELVARTILDVTTAAPAA